VNSRLGLWTPLSTRPKQPPPCLLRWAPCPNGAPDVARSSWEFPEGTGVGESRNPSDLVSQGLDPKNSSSALRLRFHVRNGLPKAISATPKDHGWEAVVLKGRLYVIVDVSQMNDSGSKEAFVSLLEYAEEVLECSHVIVCFEKCQSSNTKTAIRNFLFLGFQPLAPGHEYLPTNPNLVSFLYTIWKSSNNYILSNLLIIRIKLFTLFTNECRKKEERKKKKKMQKNLQKTKIQKKSSFQERMSALFRKKKRKLRLSPFIPSQFHFWLILNAGVNIFLYSETFVTEWFFGFFRLLKKLSWIPLNFKTM